MTPFHGLKDTHIKARGNKNNIVIPFLPEPAPVTSLAPSDPLPQDYENIEKHIHDSRYMILEDIGNLEEKIDELDAKASKLLESNNRLELRMTSLETLLREALKRA